MKKFEFNPRKFASGGLIILLGMGTAIGSIDYSLGTLARMGPGYYPLMLGVLLAFLGLLIVATPDSPDEMMPSEDEVDAAAKKPSPIRPWVATVGSMLAFMLLGKYGGLVPATFAMIFIAALGDKDNSLLASVLLGLGVTAFAVGVFYYGMQMQFPLFNWG
ncbi:tripartite tricarboxylate transporter TctB family protein [Pusillimonas sp. ANT_WB101]|uniref:tripartite tricarboxylate transporter TctB family protein n=1 Tax=Pusillimonas sp. ANT_WB101 TaxID=2597356 RepID=UPI0011ED0039|nr:tripartite tricarboxylate transporter TctB family protein [Pusillimonas sp. ANT_WB101]KAA0889290.1 tripartite tricarboxylate transporter TctB family protein [Pusillimonas sp. ANT_WB101]